MPGTKLYEYRCGCGCAYVGITDRSTWARDREHWQRVGPMWKHAADGCPNLMRGPILLAIYPDRAEAERAEGVRIRRYARRGKSLNIMKVKERR